MEYLFVYGTLRRDFGHPMGAFLKSEAEFFCMAKVAGCLYDLGEYPGLSLNTPTGRQVIGEVYRKEEMSALLAVLDEYEGVADVYSPEFPYSRVRAEVLSEQGTLLDVWLYAYQGDTADLPVISGGDYLSYLKTRSRNFS